MSIIEWSAAAVALLGAWLLGYRPSVLRLAGWVCFLISNVLWGLWGLSVGAVPLVIMQGFFLITSVRGIHATWKEKS